MSNPTLERRARLFRNGRNQAVRIPREFELPGDEVILHKEGDRLIVEPVKKPNGLAELLASWEPLDEEFPTIEDPPVQPEDIF
ncbi:MAG: antitoxin [Candidatus Contendobacter sp.]|nr:MAG: antitoxin [Candidatus Contendobacter sp.]